MTRGGHLGARASELSAAKRRTVSVPVTFEALALIAATAPVWFPAAAAADLVRSPRRHDRGRAVGELVRDLDEGSVAVIFPEGTFFGDARKDLAVDASIQAVVARGGPCQPGSRAREPGEPAQGR